MRKKNYKGRCEKRTLPKCDGGCRTYNPIQYKYAGMLESNDDVTAFRCNVALDGLGMGDYTTDFVCALKNGDVMVRECQPQTPHEAHDGKAAGCFQRIRDELWCHGLGTGH